ncbi:MAG: 2-oxoglutarate dehydrogenase complex dihydrolipoyllysine-residue succinyltransferase [Gemmatimonadaceae bacterium]
MTSIKVPPLGESIVEATVSRWMKKEGDQVSPGDTLVELETDKITVEVPAMSRGVLTKQAHKEGDVVKVNDVLGEIDESAATAAPKRQATPVASTASSQRNTDGVNAPPSPPPASAPPATPAPVKAEAAKSEIRASPAAERLATQQKVDLAGITGTGRGGVVSKADVIEQSRDGAAAPSSSRQGAAEAPSPSLGSPSAPTAPQPSRAFAPLPPATGERETREKMSTRRRRIAEHLLESQHATAHLTTFNEIDMSAVEALRGRIKERIEKEQGVRLSVMPFFVKAACLALKAYPVVNAQIDGDSIVYKHYVNMGIAVASEGGLVVPSIKDADRKGLLDIARDISAVAKKARDGKLTMEDLTGGTFTITNGGVFGSLVSTPILNYPQVGILGLHKIQDRPMAVAGKVEVRPMMYVALSYDHRAIDGQQAVLFLVRVKELMEDPATMLVE